MLKHDLILVRLDLILVRLDHVVSRPPPTVVTGLVDRDLQGFASGIARTEHTLVIHCAQRGEKLDKS
jgi:hypothetical protein